MQREDQSLAHSRRNKQEQKQSTSTIVSSLSNQPSWKIFNDAQLPKLRVAEDERLHIDVVAPEAPGWNTANWFSRQFRRLSGVEEFNEIYRKAICNDSNSSFYEKMTEAAGIELQLRGTPISKTPQHGPSFYIANHPLFGWDAISLTATILKHRPDAKLVLTWGLDQLPPLRPHTIFANNVKGSFDYQSYNSTAKLEIEEHLSTGGAIILFPSGWLSAQQPDGRILDRKWTWSLGKRALSHQANVIPVNFEPQHTQSYYQIQKVLGDRDFLAALLLRESNFLHGRRLIGTVGRVLRPKDYGDLDYQAATAYFRTITQMLGSNRLMS